MKLSELFQVEYGINIELNKCEFVNSGGVNFVSRTAQNNGVVAKVKHIKGKKPQPAGVLTCAASGSVMSAFVQVKPFYSGRDLYILTPLRKMTLEEKLYYCICIKNNAYRYSYGRQANKSLKDIQIPDVPPKWIKNFSINYEIINTKMELKQHKLEVQKWGQISLSGKEGILKLQNCKCSNASELEDGDDIFYVGAKKNDNGIMRTVKHNKELITKGNCIVFICDGQGSIGYTNYMNRDFIGSTTLTVGHNKQLNKYTALFLVSILDLERPKYSFGRKYRKNLAETKIKLPQNDNGEVDWEYMERYIKSLPYSDRI